MIVKHRTWWIVAGSSLVILMATLATIRLQGLLRSRHAPESRLSEGGLLPVDRARKVHALEQMTDEVDSPDLPISQFDVAQTEAEATMMQFKSASASAPELSNEFPLPWRLFALTGSDNRARVGISDSRTGRDFMLSIGDVVHGMMLVSVSCDDETAVFSRADGVWTLKMSALQKGESKTSSLRKVVPTGGRGVIFGIDDLSAEDFQFVRDGGVMEIISDGAEDASSGDFLLTAEVKEVPLVGRNGHAALIGTEVLSVEQAEFIGRGGLLVVSAPEEPVERPIQEVLLSKVDMGDRDISISNFDQAWMSFLAQGGVIHIQYQ